MNKSSISTSSFSSSSIIKLLNEETIFSFLSSLVESGKRTNLVFLGDSVSIQLYRFLLCDLIRSGIPLINNGHIFAHSPNYTELQIPSKYLNSSSSSSSSSKPGILRLHSLQINLPCVDRNDGIDLGINLELARKYSRLCQTNNNTEKERASYLYTRYIIKRYISLSNNPTSIATTSPNTPTIAPSSTTSIDITTTSIAIPPTSHTYLIWNYGLHIKSNQLWAINGMINGLYNEALFLKNKKKNITILYRETSSQTFSAVAGIVLYMSITFNIFFSTLFQSFYFIF